MSTSPNLEIPHVVQSQAQKEVTINAAIDKVDKALTGLLAVDVGVESTPHTLSADESHENFAIQFTGTHPGGTYIVELDPTARPIVLVNATSGNVTVKPTGGASRIVYAGETLMVYNTGASLVDVTNPKFQRQEKSSTAAPASGTWAKGDITWNSSPDAGEPTGWVCTVAGTPGTWEVIGYVNPVRTGSAAPTANADFVGQIFVDTTAGTAYMAIGTGSGAGDWDQISN